MIICFSCSPETKRKLDLLVQKGAYIDYSAAISAAIDNQLILEERVAESGAVVIHDPQNGGASPPVEPPTARRLSVTSNAAEAGVFLPFSRRASGSPPARAEMPAEEGDSVITPDRWFFGQYNKLLPLKANCRLIAHLLEQASAGVSPKTIAEAVQRHMPELRQWLEDFDFRNDLEREAALSTAFPKKDTKSILRYTNQFVLSVNKDGNLSGFPVALGLLNRIDAKATRISLTEAGLRFADLPNPVLDPPHQPEQRFSEDEIRFLLGHIRSHVPREHAAYVTILRAIAHDASSPEALDTTLKALLNSGGAMISDSYLSTQRAGAISRMTDLGLLARQRDGIRVKYALTPKGRAYIDGSETTVG